MGIPLVFLFIKLWEKLFLLIPFSVFFELLSVKILFSQLIVFFVYCIFSLILRHDLY